MKLLMMMDNENRLERIRTAFYEGCGEGIVSVSQNAEEAFEQIRQGVWDALLLQGRVGKTAARLLYERIPACTPALMFMEDEPLIADFASDCRLPSEVSDAGVIRLLLLLAKKPLPVLAAVQRERREKAVKQFLETLGMHPSWKGSKYAFWCLSRCVPLPWAERIAMTELYRECAAQFATTAAAVERCLRLAVENVFTVGNIQGIERFFGNSIDPERGKPTNRVFLMKGIKQIRLLLDGAAFGKEQ